MTCHYVHLTDAEADSATSTFAPGLWGRSHERQSPSHRCQFCRLMSSLTSSDLVPTPRTVMSVQLAPGRHLLSKSMNRQILANYTLLNPSTATAVVPATVIACLDSCRSPSEVSYETSETTGSDPCHLTYCSPLTYPTQASRASFLSLNLPSTCPPQGLCTGCSRCLEHASPREPPGSHPHLPRSLLKRHLHGPAF